MDAAATFRASLVAYTAYKFRLSPNAVQVRELTSQLETLRQVFNSALAYWRDLYDAEKRSPKASEVYRVFSTLRNLQIKDLAEGGNGPHWLAKVSATAMRDTCTRVKKAFTRFFDIVKGKIAAPKQRKPRKDGKPTGYPRFKPYARLTSIPFDNYGAGCRLLKAGKPLRCDAPKSRREYRLDVFGIGRLRINAHRPIVGTIKTVCVEREPDGKWYAVIVAQTSDVKPKPKRGPAVGIDVGLEHFLTTSDGEHRPNPKHLKRSLKKLRRLQRSASRKSEVAKKQKVKFRERKNLQKSFREVAKLHVRVRDMRKEHHHKEAVRLVRESGTICVESLNLMNMVKNNKLSRSISDAAWGGFLIVLKNKAERAGVQFVEVDARGTSQMCPMCDGKVRKTLKERTHNCPHCGYVAQRDHAAAQNILKRGTGLHAPGLGAVVRNLGVGRGGQRSPKRSPKRLGCVTLRPGVP